MSYYPDEERHNWPEERVTRDRRRYSNEEEWEDDPQRPLKHSGLGVASFLIALLTGVGEFLFVVLCVLLAASSSGGEIDEESPAAIAMGLMILAGLGIALIGVGLGVGGLFQSKRNKLFAVLGICFNALILAGVTALMCIGLLAG